MPSPPPELLQFAGSLIAILALAWTARTLGLGPEPRLEDEAAAQAACDAAAPGFAPIALSVDREGRGAIARDATGRILVLRPHGTHFASRILPPNASARIDGETLVVDSAEKNFGHARLVLDDAPAWVQAIGARTSALHA